MGKKNDQILMKYRIFMSKLRCQFSCTRNYDSQVASLEKNKIKTNHILKKMAANILIQIYSRWVTKFIKVGLKL